MRRYFRELLRDVQGYAPGEQPRGENIVKLNTNENPYPPSPRVIEAIRRLDTADLRKYPDPGAEALRQACARRHGFPGSDWVVAGNGMDELLALALRAFVDPGDAVLSVDPTYTLYEVLCALHGCRMRCVPLNDAWLPPESFYRDQARMCFLARPNAPTGVAMCREDVERFCAGFNGVVVIDEAYADFAGDHCMDFPLSFDNVIVMRTFSKSFSLAGMRIGIAAARPELIGEFLKIKDSYNLSAASQAAGLAAMEDYDYMRACADKVRRTRDRLRKTLIELGFDVPESQSNFLLAQWTGTPDAAAIFQTLRERGVLVRYFPRPRIEQALRISIGTEEECDRLIAELRDIVS